MATSRTAIFTSFHSPFRCDCPTFRLEFFPASEKELEHLLQVDAYPGRVFEGTVLRMADEAEFTPTNVQTKEDRTRLVYAVVVSLDNPELALKPGMIADVEFGE